VAAKFSRPKRPRNSSRSTTVSAATVLARSAYLTRLSSDTRMRRVSRLISTPRSVSTDDGGCSLVVSRPISASDALRISKCAHARVSWTPLRITGAPERSKTASSMETSPASSMYIPSACRHAHRSSTSTSEQPSASPAARRCLSHSTTVGSRDGCAASKRWSASRALCTSRLDARAHLVASAALPKQQRSSTMNPSLVTAQFRCHSRDWRPNCL